MINSPFLSLELFRIVYMTLLDSQMNIVLVNKQLMFFKIKPIFF